MSLSLPVLHFSPRSSSSSSRISLRNNSPSLRIFKGLRQLQPSHNAQSRRLSHLQNTCRIVSLAANMTAGQSNGPGKLSLDRSLEAVRNFWESLPQPIRSFPWTKVFSSFALIIFELTCAVTKYLFVPWFVVTSLSEMSYCAMKRKMNLIPLPLLVGFAVAGVLKNTALEVSPNLKEAEFPWHLLAMAIFFLVLKLPGPYYPSLLRIFIPHFANGGIWRTLFSTFRWYRKHEDSLSVVPGASANKGHSEESELL